MSAIVYHLNELISDTTNVEFSMSGNIVLPSGTTLERITDIVGSLRYNSELGHFEARDSTGWMPIGNFLLDSDGDTSITVENITGSDDDVINFTVAGTLMGFIDTVGLTIDGAVQADLFVGEINGGTY